MIMVKKQKKPLLWHAPDQDFTLERHVIDPDNMESFNAFIDKNIPMDPAVRISALKLIQSVLDGSSSELESKPFYNDGKNLSFRIFFA